MKRNYTFIKKDFKVFDRIPIKLHENCGRDLEIESIGSIFFQAIRTEAIAVIPGDTKEVLLQDLIALAPAVLIAGAFELCPAAGT